MHKSNEFIYNAIRNGADGYVYKGDSDNDLVAAINAVSNGALYLSPQISSVYETENRNLLCHQDSQKKTLLTKRETEVLKLVAKGYKSKEIAAHLFVSKRTIDVHRTNIMKKLNLNTATKLTAYAVSIGYIQNFN